MGTTVLVLALTLGAPALKDKETTPSLVGEWVVESVTSNGASVSVTGGMRYIFTPDGQWLIRREGMELILDGGTRGYSVDPKPNTPTVDLITTRIKGPETRLFGIYKIEGDTLTICGTRTKGGDRPTKFESLEGSNTTLYVLKRPK
jgi:uncharacterized protein (TIGR03067 family)